MKKFISVILTMALIIGVMAPCSMLMTFPAVAVTPQQEVAFTNGGVENGAFERKNMAAPTFAGSTTEEKHSGLYSQKITFKSGEQFNFWLNVEGDKYNNLPEDDLFITFWAKAGSDGYAGNLCYDPIFFIDSNGTENKKTLNPQYAFGSSTVNQELPKEWTKYYISAQRKDTVNGIVKYQVRFSVKGVGTVYLDDFDLVSRDETAFTNGGVENGAFERKNMAAPTFAGSTTEEKHGGLYSQKITFKSGEQFNFWLNVEGDKYNNLPENDDLFITFWAKAGSDGYAGNLCYDPIYFYDSNGTEYKKTLSAQYAFGSSTVNQELPKEWTKYYISAQRKDTVNGIVKYQVRFSVKGVGTVYLDDFDLETHEHTVVTDAAVEATCTESGLTAGSHCSVCGAVITAQTVVPATGHTYGTATYSWLGDKCTATAVCTKCSDGTTGHSVTLTITGNYVKDTDANCTVAEKGHYTATFTDAPFTGTSSTETNTATNGQPNGHTQATKIENLVAPKFDSVSKTYTDGSYDEVVYCSVCYEEISRTSKALSIDDYADTKDLSSLLKVYTQTNPDNNSIRIITLLDNDIDVYGQVGFKISIDGSDTYERSVNTVYTSLINGGNTLLASDVNKDAMYFVILTMCFGDEKPTTITAQPYVEFWADKDGKFDVTLGEIKSINPSQLLG